MTANTSECKNFLNTHQATANLGPWTRLFKRKDQNGEWMRGFANSDSTLFALVGEDHQSHLHMIGTCNSLNILHMMAGTTTAPQAAPVASLFQKYPPTAYDCSHGETFTGEIIAGLFEPHENHGEGVQFRLNYGIEDGYMFDEESASTYQLVHDLLHPIFGNKLQVGLTESTHSVLMPGVVCDDDSNPQYQQLADQVRAILIQAGVKLIDGAFYNPANNPHKNKMGP